MKFIKESEFRRLNVKAQAVFLDWWKCEYGDLYFHDTRGVSFINEKLENAINGDFDYFKTLGVIPLFTEGQLREFIEEKTNGILELTHYINKGVVRGIIIWKSASKSSFGDIILSKNIEKVDIINLYWDVACELANKEALNQKEVS